MKNTIISKNNLVEIANFEKNLPELKGIKVSKAHAIGEWICKQLDELISSGKVCAGQKLPPKTEFAYRLGVSIGTIQNALKYVEDKGYLEAKPCIGTLIRDKNSSLALNKKNISKRDILTQKIKIYIKSQKYKSGDKIASSKEIARILKQPANTVRLALENLSNEGILIHNFRNSDSQTGWFLAKDDFVTETQELKSETLVEQAVKKMENYILRNCKVGERIAPHAELAQRFDTSMSTIHTALKNLIDRGILMTRRGQYGTYILKMPDSANIIMPKETSIFAPASEAVVYYYKKIQNQLKKIIAEKYNVGDKLPSITQFAQILEVSPNTIRKAMLSLAEDGYVRSERGRYGGTFVIEIPLDSSQSFKWLAVNPKFAQVFNE